MDILTKHLLKIRNQWSQMKLQAHPLHETFLQNRIYFYSQHNLSKRKTVQSILIMERKRLQFQRIKNTFNPDKGVPITHLLINNAHVSNPNDMSGIILNT